MFRLDENVARETAAAREPAAGPWVEIATGGLPEKSGKYLTRCEDGYIADFYFSAQHGQFNTFDDNETTEYAYTGVTHWSEIRSPGGVDWW